MIVSCEDRPTANHFTINCRFHERQVKLKRGSGPMPVVCCPSVHVRIGASSFSLDVH